MIKLADFLAKLRMGWLERTIYTRVEDKFSVSVEEIPPLLPSSMAGEIVYNTEAVKSSVYLEANSKPSGDPALLHKMIIDGSIAMENLLHLSYEEVVNACSSCGI